MDDPETADQDDAMRPLRWRAVRSIWPGPMVWAFWGLTFWCALVLVRLAPHLEFITFPLALAAAVAVFIVGQVAYRVAVAPLLARLRKAVPVPPPPAGAATDAAYLTPPRPSYPVVEVLRGQCGWVHLRLRVEASGRVRAYRVVEQAPGRVFEAAVAQALLKAQLPPGDDREVLSLITFLTPGPEAPEWAAARMQATEAPAA